MLGSRARIQWSGGSHGHQGLIADIYLSYEALYTCCEGYTDREYIRNEANRQHTCIYIVWIYGVQLGGLALCYHGLREP